MKKKTEKTSNTGKQSVAYAINTVQGKPRSINCVVSGKSYVLPASHKSFDEVVKEVKKKNPDTRKLVRLMSKAEIIREYSQNKVVVSGGCLYYKGEKLGGFLVETILDLEARGFPNKPLIRFLENLMLNPDPAVRQNLYKYLSQEKFTMTPDGYFLAYKGILNSGYSATAGDIELIHGKQQDGRVYNGKGEYIEVKRDSVSKSNCSKGLHVGTFGFASSFSEKCVLIKVHPKDVVYIESGAVKCKVCAYKVVDDLVNKQKLSEPLDARFLSDDDEDAPMWRQTTETATCCA